MDYLTTKETAKKWNVSMRNIQRLLTEGRIIGAKKYGKTWLIPAGAEKPADPRKKPSRPSIAYLGYYPMPKDDPDSVFDSFEGDIRNLVVADLAYWRGDCQPIKQLYASIPESDRAKLDAASLATAAAIATGDVALYDEIERFLQVCLAKAPDERARRLISLPKVNAAVGMMTPELVPDWLRNCDFSLFPAELMPFLTYLNIMYLRNTLDYPAVYNSSRTAITLLSDEKTFTWIDVLLRVLCALACCTLGNDDEARRYLIDAMDLALPHGMITPFADYLAHFSGMMEECLAQKYPQYLKPVIAQWNERFANWIDFHNQFTRQNMTVILTPQEYQVALHIVRGLTYAETASRMQLSKGRVKNIVSTVYQKLYIKNRRDLKLFIIG